jgi:CheY-like chemotaxis protein
MPNILFFDDSLATENQIFLMELRHAVKGTTIQVVQEKTVHHAEQKFKTVPLLIAILDVMAPWPGEQAKEAQAGLEILRRCREGAYDPKNAAIPIFMRTARDEPHIRRLAFELGCTNFFTVGRQDPELIAAIVAICTP